MEKIVHILLSDLPIAQSLRDRIPVAAEIVFEFEEESFRFMRENKSPGRTASEALRIMASLSGANVMVDEEWSTDMQEIMRENRANDRDPWAE
jgi:hypothetical protein